MNLRVQRQTLTDKSTIGELSIDGTFECFTLEDRVRPVKIKGETAIPAGTYEVAITFSNRFQRRLPELKEVPNFEGIRIHSGNKAEDTEGCILVGTSKKENFIENSRVAFTALFEKIEKAAMNNEKVMIEIV